VSFLLDTNALSEPMRSYPNAGYEAWLMRADTGRALFASVVSLGEVRRGVSLLPQGSKRERLEAMLRTFMSSFEERIIPVSSDIALVWGELSALHRGRGHHPGMADELVAATALVHDLTVITRNVADFEHSGCKYLCPWT
jgi:predicted nucleic acid-binding protein